MTYPEDGPAPCDQDTSETPEHGPYRGTIRRISATDAMTVMFELCDSDPAFLAKIASPSLAINDTAWLGSRIDPASVEQRILSEVNGTGPFRLDSRGDAEGMTLTRFEGYWGESAHPDAVIFVTEPDAGRRLSRLREGSVDAIDLVAPSDIAAVRETEDVTLVQREGLNVAYVGFNNRFAPFDQEVIRQALASGIDRQSIVEDAFPPGTELATHFLPCAIPFGCDGPGWPEHDPTAARATLAQAGFPDGFPTTITYSDEARDYLPDPGAVAAALQIQLREHLGVEATLRVMPFDELTSTADAGDLDGIYLLGARTRYPDATVLLERHFGPASSAQFGRRFDDIGRALDQGRSSADPKERAEGYGRVNGRIRLHVPMVPLAHVGSTAAFRSDVRGAHTSATATERFATVVPGDRTRFGYMQATRPAGLYCADETEAGTLRVCAQLSEPLYRHDVPEPGLTPALAQACVPDADLIVWTCVLRQGISFHDGSRLDANDVVLSFAVQWDADHPRHRGRDGLFEGFQDRFGGLLNPPATP
ncbi:MAG: peptide ABC transporter substrate-binding protein [Chloroflexi bacterium]|nr:peptide ABC transporter substrate-binding protein [Chloroflexota bacterium]